MSGHNTPWWEPIAHFSAHILVGSLIFIVIAAGSIGLEKLVDYVANSWALSDFTSTVLHGMAHAILLGDCVLFGLYLISVMIKTAKEYFK